MLVNRRWLPRWLKIIGIVIAGLLVTILALLIGVGWYVKNQMLDSGGKLEPSKAAYDVRHSDCRTSQRFRTSRQRKLIISFHAKVSQAV